MSSSSASQTSDAGWSKHFLQLNEDKTEILLVGPKALRQNIPSLLTPLSVKPCEHVNNLGVILDADLTFQRHISNISKTAFYHLRNISKVRCFLSQSDSESWFLLSFPVDWTAAMLFLLD